MPPAQCEITGTQLSDQKDNEINLIQRSATHAGCTYRTGPVRPEERGLCPQSLLLGTTPYHTTFRDPSQNGGPLK